MIEILKYKRVTTSGKIIGQVDIKVFINEVPWIIRRINHFCNGNKRWFAYSNFKDESTNEPQYLAYAELGMKIHNTQLLEALAEPVAKYCLENNIAEIPTLNISEKKEFVGDLPF
jgi:hypothetical protein